MLTVHHLGVSQSDRIVWLCEELGLEYRLVRYDRDPKTRLAPEKYKALHPSGTAPVIVDDAIVLAESGAIIDYVLGKYGKGRLSLDASHPDFAKYLYWYNFANGSLMPAMMGMMSEGGIADIMKDRVIRGLAALDDHVGQNVWLAGDIFTAADIMIAFPLTTMREFLPIDLTPYSNILKYLERLSERPAFQRAMRKADPDLVMKLT